MNCIFANLESYILHLLKKVLSKEINDAENIKIHQFCTTAIWVEKYQFSPQLLEIIKNLLPLHLFYYNFLIITLFKISSTLLLLGKQQHHWCIQNPTMRFYISNQTTIQAFLQLNKSNLVYPDSILWISICNYALPTGF